MAAGGTLLLRYQYNPGIAPSSGRYAAGSFIPLDKEHPTLFLVVHPKCPCTRASLLELDKILTTHAGHVAAHAIFVEPDGVDDAWVKDELWKQASEMLNLDTRIDHTGKIARSLGVQTSGTVLVFGPDGANLFCGGITSARGHEGANPGTEAVIALLDGRSATHDHPTYGCELSNAGSQCPGCTEPAGP